jgi:hypothetical protein
MKKVIFLLIVGFVLASCEMLEDHEIYTVLESSRFSFAESSLSLAADGIAYLPLDADNATKKTGNMYLYYDEELIEITENHAGLFIKALQTGTTELTATVGKYETTCVITVGDQIETEKRIEVSPEELHVEYGDSGRITATLTNGAPEDLENFSFFTADENITLIPNVNSCLIVGMGRGEATVTISHPLADNKQVTIYVE